MDSTEDSAASHASTEEASAAGGALLDSSEWTHAVVENAVDGIIAIDEHGIIQYCNHSVERIFGHSRENLVGKPVNVLMPEPHASAHDDYLARYLQTGERRIIGIGREVEGLKANGETVPLELSVSEVEVDGRRMFAGTVHDITKRRKAQEEKDRLLRDLNKRNIELVCLYRATEAMQSSELLSDMFREVVQLIPPAFLYSEVTRCRLNFDGDRYVSSPFLATPWRLAADIVVAGRRRGELEVFYLEERPPLQEGPFLREERELMDALANSIAFTIERREAEAKVIQASKLASIGELAAGVSHEINNPVNGIMNCADILAKNFEEGSKNRQFAELVKSEADRIATIVRNLLTFARQERERHSPARLCDIVEVVLSLTRKKLEKSHVILEVDVPPGLPMIPCRSEQLQQVLMNLIINAMHALDERYRGSNPDKILRIEAEETAQEGEPYLRLMVEDHGSGIAPQHMERLFDPFFTTKGRDVGTGLGLSISSAIVREHGGQMSVESEHGRYARFYVDLPLTPPAAGAAPASEE